MTATDPASLSNLPSNAISLTEALARSKPADKAQQRFRKLVAQIERQRERLKQWEDYSPRYNQRVSGELGPLLEKLRAARKQMAALIDELLSAPARGRRLGKAQRSKLEQVLMQLVEDLLQEADDDALKALRDKYRAPVDEEDRLFQMEVTRDVLQGLTGLDIDDDHGARSPEELMEHVLHTLEQRDEVRRAEQRRGRDREEHTKARTGAAQAEHGRAAREISQSLRDVFRKLVSALHPDREPDAAERQRKNGLMQRVNRAYEANDLLALLSLQLEVEQVGAAHLSSLTPQRLAQYTQILREQFANLDAELERAMQPYLMAMGRRRSRGLTPADVDRQLNADVAEVQTILRQVHEDLVAYRDPDRLRKRLAECELEAPDPFDDPEDLAALMDSFQPAPRGRRSRR